VNHHAKHAGGGLAVAGKLDDEVRSAGQFGFAGEAATAGGDIPHLHRYGRFSNAFASAEDHRPAVVQYSNRSPILMGRIGRAVFAKGIDDLCKCFG